MVDEFDEVRCYLRLNNLSASKRILAQLQPLSFKAVGVSLSASEVSLTRPVPFFDVLIRITSGTPSVSSQVPSQFPSNFSVVFQFHFVVRLKVSLSRRNNVMAATNL